MMRDIIIDDKLVSLLKKKENLEDEIRSIPEYVTNLQVKNYDGKTINMRTISSVNTLLEAFSIVNGAYQSLKSFDMLIAEGDCNEETKIFGYKWEDWQSDFKGVYKNITLRSKLEKINKAINDIENFYSDDRKEENAFNKLLADIDQI